MCVDLPVLFDALVQDVDIIRMETQLTRMTPREEKSLNANVESSKIYNSGQGENVLSDVDKNRDGKQQAYIEIPHQKKLL